MTRIMSLLKLILLFYPSITWGYDLELTCQKEGRLGDWHLESAVSDIIRPSRSEAEMLCADAEFCMGQFKAIGRLARQVSSVTNEVARLKTLQDKARRRDRNAIAELQNRVDDCLNNNSPLLANAFEDNRIAIFYPHHGMNSNQSGVYDREKIEWIVENALKHGVDPFAALAIKLLEDAQDLATPTSNQSTNSEEEPDTYYSDQYGRIPVDSIAAYDVNGCLNPKGTFNYISKKRHAGPYRQLSERLDTAREALIEIERDRGVENFQVAESELEYLQGEIARLTEELPNDQIETDISALSIREQIETIDQYIAHLQERPEVKAYLVAQEQVLIYEGQLDTLKKSIVGVVVSPRPQARPHSGDPTPPAPVISEENRMFEEQALEMVDAELECANNRMCYTSIRTPAKRVTYHLDPQGSQTYTICDRESLTIDRAHAPNFELLATGETPRGCCVDVKSNQGPEEIEARIGEVKGLMGFEFIKQRVQSRSRSGSLSHALQAFNGYGTFGATEEMDNACLEGVNMSTMPIYGARAADLMVNSLMNNPGIKAIIRTKQQVTSQNPVSMLCLQKGPGIHKVNGESFLNEQKAYMNRPECARHFKNRSLVD
jgi:hypothetical protein